MLIETGAPRAVVAEQARSILRAFAAAGLRVSMARAFELLRTIHIAENPAAVLAEVRSTPPMPSRCHPLAALPDEP